MTQLQTALQNSALAGLVDKERYISQDEYLPKLLFNTDEDHVKTHLDEELMSCQSFTFAVAFITEAVLTMLKPKLADLALKGISGRILTSNYLGFNQPKVFKELLKIPNLTVRVLKESDSFHAKGYIFDKGEYQSMIIGSSNLTETALIRNYEWNLRITSYENAALTEQVINEVEQQWQRAQTLTPEWIAQYEENYQAIDFRRRNELVADIQEEDSARYSTITPNNMQKDALKSLNFLRHEGHQKALIVSATGTGKTYLGAFDVQKVNPKKFLFIVHREQILKKAQTSFQQVLGGDSADYGLLSGNESNRDARYLFATIQTLSKEATLAKFDPEEFDYIMIDEAHKSGASSYHRVIDYFKPQFLLGMTATPERTDDFNIYELFDYNLAYEIRLQDALEDDMLAPFHYIGVTDYELNGEIGEETTSLQHLVSTERMDYVEQQLNYYGYSGDSVHGLIFCSRKDEAREVARIMTEKGYASIALTGEDSIDDREQAIHDFEQGRYQYIVTVDIFNEGIDIPCINQVVMLRNTQSSIIFIQQLGRGLRKFPRKEFVTVIDFIGNYKNNYLIPIALTGDHSRNKNSLRSKLSTDQVIGMSTINFTEVAKQRVYDSINNSNLTELKLLRDDYQDLKKRLGRIPLLFDFTTHGSIDGSVLVSKFDSYYQFLIKMKEEVHLEIYEEMVLRMLSKELLNGMRIHELLSLKLLFEKDGIVSADDFKQALEQVHGRTDQNTLNAMLSVLNLDFYQKANQKKYGVEPYVVLSNNEYHLNQRILQSYQSNEYFNQLVDDALATGLFKADRYDQTQPLTIGKKYTRKDMCRLLGWKKDLSAVVNGYKLAYGTCPLFITYTKSQDIDDGIKYEDEFLNSATMRMFTRSPRKLDSPEVQAMVQGNASGALKMPLFVKKSDDEGGDYYYLGLVNIDKRSLQQESMLDKKGKEVSVVTMNLILEKPVQYQLYLNLTKD
ncbi:NgoFVII family restriction endonuclease [Latilactobacillus sakei]|uniref:DEAD/DEAH box helicase n=1 Tax=Latilactobacillus sakei TaxID=1599 RepID=UPI002073FF29|nr:DEAD/DEAH box helicase [Latilactobacillus sakei]USG07258.1 NgoFVII family restriction endonuclease [Latilactobacillus sakei]USG10934.1 NgoFVII family restriction endonuclease [Latilactobacillus sakei]